ncbi:phosphomevalonate kinase isoform X3 [Anarhichas minor]|uniref:phosphomevalonate kinase isoform X3 n=1 Tax=Anarhichas minor TaxID=65739 RepID=UPI003F734148
MEDRVSGPRLVLVFSGKRKSGKDYVTDLIHNRLGSDVCCVLRLSGPLKQQYAEVVSDARRLSDLQWFWSEFPRQTQSVRVQSSEETRKQRGWSFSAGKITRLSVYLYVCRSARLCSPVCLSGVDDAESECGLDSGVDFDWIVTNETDAPSLEEQLQPIMKLVEDAASSSL